jgi:hypothetical protein
MLGDIALDVLGGSSKSYSQHHDNDMSTLTPSEANGARGLPLSSHRIRLPHADLIPRSVQHDASSAVPGYRNLNIDIPLNTRSSLSMELTHDGKVMELVARFEAYTDFEGSDVPQALGGDRTRASSAATIRPFEAMIDSIQASTIDAVVKDVEASPLPTEEESHSPRKSIPSQWKPTPRAPVLRTKMRGEEREKRKSTQDNSPSDGRTVRGTRSSVDLRKLPSAESTAFLTKEKNDTIKITVSPSRASRSKTHTRAPSVISTGDSVFHSARHSPVSQTADRVLSSACSPTSFVTAEELHDEIPQFALSEADDIEQKTPVPPKLSLRIPHASSSTDRRPPFSLASASSSGSGTPASPSRSSRIPRMVSTVEITSKTSSVKNVKNDTKVPQPISGEGPGRNAGLEHKKATSTEPQDVVLHETPAATPMRHVRTLNSTGTTPIISRNPLEKSNSEPDKHAMITSYLENVELDPRPEETPSLSTPLNTEPPILTKGMSGLLLKPTPSASSSRVTSQSTVKATPLDDSILNDTAVLSCRVKAESTGMNTRLPNQVPSLVSPITLTRCRSTKHR